MIVGQSLDSVDQHLVQIRRCWPASAKFRRPLLTDVGICSRRHSLAEFDQTLARFDQMLAGVDQMIVDSLLKMHTCVVDPCEMGSPCTELGKEYPIGMVCGGETRYGIPAPPRLRKSDKSGRNTQIRKSPRKMCEVLVFPTTSPVPIVERICVCETLSPCKSRFWEQH